MAVDITAGEGSLLWKAGIDTSDLESGMQKVTDAIQLSLKKQVDLQQQATQSGKQMAQSILQSVASLNGLDAGLDKQAGGLAAFGQGLRTLSGQISQYIASIEVQLRGLEGESIDIKGHVDSKPLLDALTVLKSEIGVINSDTIAIHAEAVDVQPLLKALNTVQAEYDKFSQKSLTLKVSADVSGLNGLSNTVSQTSLDAFKTHREDITRAIQDYKNLQQTGTAAFDAIDRAAKSADTEVSITVKPPDIASIQRSFDALRSRIDGLKNAAIELTVQGVDTKSLEASIAKLQKGTTGLQNISLQADLDTDAFQKKYDRLVGEVTRLENMSIALKAKGLDTTKLDADLAGLKSQLSGVAASINVTVDDTGIRRLQEQLNSLEAQQVQLKAGGLDTTQVDQDIAALREKLKLPPVEIPPVVIPPVKTGSLNELNRELEDLKRQYADLSKVDRDSDIGKGLVQNIQRVEGELEDVNKAFLRVEQNAAGSLNEKVAQLERLKQQYAALSDIDRRSTVGRGMARDIHNLDTEVQKINGEFQKTEGFIKKAGVAIGAYLTFQAGTSFLRDLVQVRGEFQKLQVSFETILGSKAKADRLMAEVTELAAKTPFTLQDVAGGAKQLLAYGVSAENVTDTLRRMGDIAAGTGADISNLILALGQVKSKGKLEGDELRQFAEANVNVVGELSKLWGKNEADIRKMVEAGKVGFTDLMDVIKSLTSEGGKFFNLTAAQAGTLSGQLSNLQDAWSRMLNDMGKNSEGVLSGAISTATTLVDHYSTVLDILGSLVIAYGVYKAALMSEIALQKIATTEAIKNALAKKGIEIGEKGITTAQVLQAGTTNILRGAWQALNITMKANPAVVVASVVGVLTLALIKLSQFTKESAVALNEYNAELSKEHDTLKGMFDAVQKTAEGTKERKEAIDAINKNYGQYLGNLLTEKSTSIELANAYEVLNGKIQDNIALRFKNKNVEDLQKQFGNLNTEVFNKIISSIADPKKAGQASRELNQLADQLNDIGDKMRKAATATEKLDLADQAIKLRNAFIQKFNIQGSSIPKLIEDFAGNKTAFNQGMEKINEFWDSFLEGSNKKAEAAKKSLADLLKEKDFASVYTQALSLAANKDDLKKILERLQSDLDAINPSDKNFTTLRNKFGKMIEEVQKKIDAYNTKKIQTENDKALKAQQALESRLNDILQQRKDILQSIEDLKRDATQSGLVKELSEVDKINERYDKALLSIQKFNNKVDEFNKKNGTSVQKIGLLDITAVNEARVKQVGNEILGKQGADILKNELDTVKGVFEQYQEAVRTVGVEKADAIFQEQTKGYSSFVDFLQGEAKKLPNQVNPQKMEVLNKAIQDAQKKQQEDDLKQRIDNFQKLITFTVSYKDQERAIYQKYNTMEQALEQNKAAFTVEQYRLAQQKINDGRSKDLLDLQTAIAKQAPLFQKLGEDLFTFSTSEIADRVKQMQKAVGDAIKSGKLEIEPGKFINLSPAMIAELKHLLKELEAKDNTLGNVFDKIAEKGPELVQSFRGMAQSVEGLNESLSQALNTLASMGDGVIQLSEKLKAAKSVSKTDITGQVNATLGVAGAIFGIMNTVVSFVNKAQERKAEEYRRQQQQLLDIYKGELEVNRLYRERAEEQVKINKLRLQGIQDEMALLKALRPQVEADFNATLQKLQKEQFFATPQQIADFIAAGGGGNAIMTGLLPLAGKTFDQLEELFAKGQLTDSAKQLFEELRKLKQEGVDIDKQLQDLKDRAQEVFTGTTADGILDSIVSGFEQGKTKMVDFTDDFEALMKKAMLNSLKFQYLEGPLKDFFQQFADASQSGGQLTQTEIDSLKQMYNTIIQNASTQFEQLQQVAGLNFGGLPGGAGNSLQGAIKGITETQAELLAGQFGGLRLTALDQLKIATQSLATLNAIQNNTGLAVVRLESVVTELQDQTSKMRQWLTIEGIKVR